MIGERGLLRGNEGPSSLRGSLVAMADIAVPLEPCIRKSGTNLMSCGTI